jgi:AcrR family transcriptional regulator
MENVRLGVETGMRTKDAMASNIETSADQAFTWGGAAERRAEERMRRRTSILDAAEALAAASGWDAVTVVQVARRARLSRALVYVYFKDKTQLLKGIRDRAFEMLGRHLAGAAAREDRGLAQVEAIVRASAAFAAASPTHFEALIRCEALALEQRTRSAGDFLGSKAEPCRRALTKAIAAGAGDGSIRPDLGDPRLVATVLWRSTFGVLQLAATGSRSPAQAPRMLDPSVAQALDLIVRSLRSSSTGVGRDTAGSEP